MKGLNRFLLLLLKKVYKASGDQVRTAGYDLRLDAIPFQTAKASREIASDVSLSLTLSFIILRKYL